MLEKLDDLVREREGIERKLSTTYSLGRDKASSRSQSKLLLPLYDEKTRSFSFEGSNKERVTMFQTLSDTTSCSTDGSDKETSWDSHEEELDNITKAKAKGLVEEGESSSDDGAFLRRSPSEPSSSSTRFENFLVGNKDGGGSLSLKRRKALSSTH